MNDEHSLEDRQVTVVADFVDKITWSGRTRREAYELYGHHPDGEEQPRRPEGYDQLTWPTSPPPVADLESVLRARMADSPKSRPAAAARKIGWLYSHWGPDTSLLAPDGEI
jgi:hypothetical protein